MAPDQTVVEEDEVSEELYPRKRICRRPIDVNELHYKKLGFNDRVAVLVTGSIGSMYAVYLFLVFSVGWMLWQAWMSQTAFDPYPFAFLLFLGNIVQLLLMPLIMVGQNIQGRHSELRAEEEYATCIATYEDIEEMMEHLAAQDVEILKQSAMMKQILQKLDDSTPTFN